MSQDKIPTSKIARASKFLKTGVQVSGNYIKHYSKAAIGKDVTKEDLEEANARDILETFQELRGTALKVAQMLSMDSINFSPTFTGVMQKAQYSVPPMSAPLAVQAFTKSTGKAPDKVFDKFNPNALKAASMGQVHEAWIGSKKYAVKIQYPGVAKSIESDLNMVKKVAPRLLGMPAHEIQPYFEEILERLLEEADYRRELQNSMEFRENCKGYAGIVIPEYYPEYSSDRVITMEWIDGVHMKEFLEANPGQEAIQSVAKNLWDLYELQIHKLRAVNADPHPGNFLMREDGTLGVLDFGCTKRLGNELYDNYFAMAVPGVFENRERGMDLLMKNELLRPTDEGERLDYIYGLFAELISLVSRPYHDGWFDFSNPGFLEEVNQVGTHVAKLKEVRGSKEFLFINRTYFGLFGLFNQLGGKMDTECQYHDYLSPGAKAAKAAGQSLRDYAIALRGEYVPQ